MGNGGLELTKYIARSLEPRHLPVRASEKPTCRFAYLALSIDGGLPLVATSRLMNLCSQPR